MFDVKEEKKMQEINVLDELLVRSAKIYSKWYTTRNAILKKELFMEFQ